MPTVQIYANKHSHVDQGVPNTNVHIATYTIYGTPSAYYYPETTVGYESRVWFGFDLSSIPVGSSIISATVSFGIDICWNQEYITDAGIFKSTSNSWTDVSITWNNAPSVAASPSATFYWDSNIGGSGNPGYSDVAIPTSDIATSLGDGQISYCLKNYVNPMPYWFIMNGGVYLTITYEAAKAVLPHSVTLGEYSGKVIIGNGSGKMIINN